MIGYITSSSDMFNTNVIDAYKISHRKILHLTSIAIDHLAFVKFEN